MQYLLQIQSLRDPIKSQINTTKNNNSNSNLELVESIVRNDDNSETLNNEFNLISNNELVEDIISIDDDDSETLNNEIPNTQMNIKYYLFKYDNLFKSIYPKLNQSDICFYNFLDVESWKSLQIGQLLTNFAIDFSILCIIKENFENVLSLPCQQNEICLEKFNKLVQYKPNFIIIPICTKSHFNVCILNMTLKEFIFIDPLYNDKGRDHYDKFLLHTKEESWTFKEITVRAKQTDSASCGVYIIMYVLNYLSTKSLLDLPNPNHYRKALKYLLIRNADDLTTFCCHCGQNKNERTKCQSCEYRVCTDCAQYYRKTFMKCKICTKRIIPKQIINI